MWGEKGRARTGTHVTRDRMCTLKSEENSLESLTSTLFKAGSLGYFSVAGWLGQKFSGIIPSLIPPGIALGLQILVCHVRLLREFWEFKVVSSIIWQILPPAQLSPEISY